jgi:hypothetical protein
LVFFHECIPVKIFVFIPGEKHTINLEYSFALSCSIDVKLEEYDDGIYDNEAAKNNQKWQNL